MYTHSYVYTYIYICVCRERYVCVHTYKRDIDKCYVCVCVYMYTHIYAYTYTCTYTYTSTHTHTYVCIFVYIYIYMYIINIHMYKFMASCVLTQMLYYMFTRACHRVRNLRFTCACVFACCVGERPPHAVRVSIGVAIGIRSCFCCNPLLCIPQPVSVESKQLHHSRDKPPWE